MRTRLLPLLLLAACGSFADIQLVVRGPQLFFRFPDEATIGWQTRRAGVGEVEYGTTPAYGSRVVEPAAVQDHVVALAGLLPDTVYHYRVLHDGAVLSEDHTFRTAAAAATVRFTVFGDTGGSGPAQRNVAAQVLASDPLLVLLPGDLIYESGREVELNARYFDPYRDLIDHIAFYPALGNHDVLTDDGQPFLDAVHLPGNERWYSFDTGGAHFVALDTNRDLAPGSEQRAWLEADLAAASATWTFVYFHHPPYSSSQHGSDLDVRGNLGPLFDAHGVDVVFTGHDHVYERTYPIFAEAAVDAAQEPDYAFPGGTIYIVTGGGGKSLYATGTSWFTAYTESVFHHVQVDVAGAFLELQAIDETGQVFDRITIAK